MSHRWVVSYLYICLCHSTMRKTFRTPMTHACCTHGAVEKRPRNSHCPSTCAVVARNRDGEILVLVSVVEAIWV